MQISNLETSTNQSITKFKNDSRPVWTFEIVSDFEFEIRVCGYYAADTGGALAGLRNDAMTSGRKRSSASNGENFDSPFG